jgi:hypothetical protein
MRFCGVYDDGSLFRNQQAAGSNPIAGSIFSNTYVCSEGLIFRTWVIL